MMVTLTWPGDGIHDQEECAKLVAGYMKNEGSRIHGGLPYVGVYEQHNSGHGLHVHIATGVPWYSKKDLSRIRRSWTRYLAGHGYLVSGGARWVRTHARLFRSSRKAAAYLAKYLLKAIAGLRRPLGARRYLRGLGGEVKVYRQSHKSIGDLLSSLKDSGSIERMWSWREDKMWVGPPTIWLLLKGGQSECNSI